MAKSRAKTKKRAKSKKEASRLLGLALLLLIILFAAYLVQETLKVRKANTKINEPTVSEPVNPFENKE